MEKAGEEADIRFDVWDLLLPSWRRGKMFFALDAALWTLTIPLTLGFMLFWLRLRLRLRGRVRADLLVLFVLIAGALPAGILVWRLSSAMHAVGVLATGYAALFGRWQLRR